METLGRPVAGHSFQTDHVSGEVLDIEQWKRHRGFLSSRASLLSEGVRTLPHEQTNPKYKENSAVFPKKGARLPQTLSAGAASPRSTAELRPDGKDAASEAPRHPSRSAARRRLCFQSQLVQGRGGPGGCSRMNRARTRPVRHGGTRSSKDFLSASSVPGTGTHRPSKSSRSVKPGGPIRPSLPRTFPVWGLPRWR